MKSRQDLRKWTLMGIDLTLFIFSYLITVWVSLNSSTSIILSGREYIVNSVIFLLSVFSMRLISKLYVNVWRYANSAAYMMIIFSDFLGGLIAILFTRFIVFTSYFGIWQSIFLVAIFDIATLFSRFIYQQHYKHLNVSLNDINKIGVAIVGAGQVGSILAEELRYNANSHYKPVCFIDVNKSKIGKYISGLPVYAEDDTIIGKLKVMPIQEIFIALPRADTNTIKELLAFYAKSDCKVKFYDIPLQESVDKKISLKEMLREVKVEDLLFRKTVSLDNTKAQSYFSDKTILVTGGGGSIGSELCRQLANMRPKKLVIFDVYENGAYEIQQDLLSQYSGEIEIKVEIGTVCDKACLETLFNTYKPQIVFHAAAHKHVPLMEHNLVEAIKNNVFGTYNVANAAEKYGVEKFILISTDKAVNPTNVMGATKRLCEMIVLCRKDSETTSFAAVRFGNVLGSNGSVVPLFKKQIERGGPITITDKRIIRYFMTIPEASQLVMQAGVMANSGELFVLNMGDPVKILDLAENMVLLSGLKPYEDIDIIETGLRPGEKLYEELLINTENCTKTENERIFIESQVVLSREEVERKLEILRTATQMYNKQGDNSKIKKVLKQVVPTYYTPNEINERKETKQILHKEEDFAAKKVAAV
ncbi:polysaccharide biosynthesis protein [Scatolibacter rhodanostii]|uniref:polysaccharide biosynthesis protein n=1 Tax=Scatolibacter rhodanostii TaxID=2014781 RepID=UPI000C07C941|nr:nucleoside-diphosphate sugar epimerase/dehydratase [Scatolibacter rhodanostii]